MSELEDTVREMLRSETFEPDELRDVLVERGHDRADVERAIAEMQRTLAERSDSPAEVAARKRARRGGRMIRAGLMIAAVGLVFGLLLLREDHKLGQPFNKPHLAEDEDEDGGKQQHESEGVSENK